ncbi:multiheme c-type cytochrome [Maribellus sediminis]|uniref:multiheme c-type cytochrome n=1 Tax=Maribellus sediminis TaxID=2696285 RepID=UPI00142FA06E|nr:multiheme c-type cytochrome [Maribellus sediminis]
MKKSVFILIGIIISIVIIAAVGTTIEDFFMPGSQPGGSGNIEHPDKCDNCHGGYDKTIEPAFNWRGSMMSQAARDPLFYACLTIAEQDAPGSGDLCIRCHAPDGWLNGRSTPTDGSALNSNDREGVQCDFCHKLVKPSDIGINPFEGNTEYTNNTYLSDQEYLSGITMIPPQSGNGMYVAHDANAKRGPFVDAAAKHQIFYSPFHSESDICGTCHDVSSPAIGENGGFTLGGINKGVGAFTTHMMLPIERTYSEWIISDFNPENNPDGVPSEAFGGNKTNVSTCQDCHMHDVSGVAANKRGTIFRDDLPLHDMTGGNTFIPDLVAQLYPDEVDSLALESGKQRALYMLQNAASMDLTVTDNSDGTQNAIVKITNNTGHKLPSGYPEGRRIWINIIALNASGNTIFESGAYNYETAELQTSGTKIYETRLGMDDNVLTAAGTANEEDGSSFHFVLNNKVIKDNRIPPQGFTNAALEAIQSPVVGYSYIDGQNYDNTLYTIPAGATFIKAQLMYQTVSKEFIEFLRDENNTNTLGQDLYDLWAANGKSAPEVMCEEEVGTPPIPDLIPISVVATGFTRNILKGSKESISVTVRVTDLNGVVIDHATVNGTFDGPTSGSVSGVTDASGLVTFTSRAIRNPIGQWCFTLESINKEGYKYSGSDSWCESDMTKSAHIGNSGNAEFGVNVYPNPFFNILNFQFTNKSDSHCLIELFDVTGKKLDVVLNEKIFAGQSYKVSYNAEKLSDDLIFYRIQFDEEVLTGKVVHR